LNAGVPLGLSSGLCWGAADFFGGIQSRRLPALTVAFWSQLAGALALAIALAIEGVRPAATGIAWGLAAGVGSGCALVLFYRSLAEGTMSMVAPISACGAIVPVAAALLTGNQPGVLAALGVLATIAGVILVSRPHTPARFAPPAVEGDPASPARGGRRVVAMALGSALGFGLFYVFVDAGLPLPDPMVRRFG
jgi:drug/metabolite transporter (DMT)-like permease